MQCSPAISNSSLAELELALVMLSEEALSVLPLITFLLLESSRWEKRGDTGGQWREALGFATSVRISVLC